MLRPGITPSTGSTGSTRSALSALTAQRHLTPEPLNVAPGLIGQPLASPRRRALAMGVDLLVVALLSGANGLWLGAGLAAVVVQLRSRRGDGLRWRAVVGWALVVLFVSLALQGFWRSWQSPRAAQGVPTAAEQASVDDDDEPVSAAAMAAAASDPARRIAELEAQLAEARKPQPWSLQRELRRLGRSLGATFGWGIVYFSLLPAFWNGQTLGKRLLHLKVVELAGQPMTVMRCLRRYGGYAAGMATGGLGFAQALWDVNRQAIQDRAAHTVVLDLREPPAPSPAPVPTPVADPAPPPPAPAP